MLPSRKWTSKKAEIPTGGHEGLTHSGNSQGKGRLKNAEAIHGWV